MLSIVPTKKFSVYELVDNGKRKIEELVELFDELVGKTNSYTIARTISRQERETSNNLDKGYLTYGEASFPLMESVFETILSDDTTFNHVPRSFVDLGSGSGRTALMACLLQHMIQFKQVTGIEILDSLYQMSVDIKNRFDNFNRAYTNDQLFSSNLKFYKGSIFDFSIFDWTSNDIIFINSTCFSDEMMSKIYNHAKQSRQGAYIITFTFPLYHLKPIILHLVRELRLETSWGQGAYSLTNSLTHSLTIIYSGYFYSKKNLGNYYFV